MEMEKGKVEIQNILIDSYVKLQGCISNIDLNRVIQNSKDAAGKSTCHVLDLMGMKEKIARRIFTPEVDLRVPLTATHTGIIHTNLDQEEQVDCDVHSQSEIQIESNDHI